MAKFKVGDKVRINDVDRINYGDFFWINGDVTEVMEVDDDGDILVKVTRGIFREEAFPIAKHEFDYIEKVAETPSKLTKNQRIKALEQAQASLETEVATLKRRIEALEQGKSYTHTPRISVEDVKPVSANEQRKAIIDEAKSFVAEVTANMIDDDFDAKEGNSTYKCINTNPEFIVNSENRTVVVLVKGAYKPVLYEKGIAKCAPDDVFNEHIGKAIALGRALGLDVSKFEQAVQPTELVIGMVVEDIDDDFPIAHGKVAEIEPKDCQGQRGYWTDKRFYAYLTHAKILDDTEAQY